MGAIQFQLVALYGQAGNLNCRANFTNQLFNEALCRTTCLDLPTVFAGDYNLDVTTLDAYDWLMHHGFVTAQTLHESLHAWNGDAQYLQRCYTT